MTVVLECKNCGKIVGCYLGKLELCKKCDHQPNCQRASMYKHNKEFLCEECGKK